MALAALAGCYHAGALVVPSKPASVAAAAAATSPSPDLQIQRIFPASISKEISSPTSSVKLNGVLIASNAIGSASTNAAQAYWLAEMMSARFAEDPVWYKDDIEDVNVDVVATHTRLRIQNDRAASATHRNTAVRKGFFSVVFLESAKLVYNKGSKEMLTPFRRSAVGERHPH